MPARPTTATPRATSSRPHGEVVGRSVRWSCRSVGPAPATDRHGNGKALVKAGCGGHTICRVTRVLLVEDDHDIAEPLARALAREGYEVGTARDGRIALQTVLDAPPDLIILDVGLPGMDGLEVCRHVRDVRPHVPILMLTARDGELETGRRASTPAPTTT